MTIKEATMDFFDSEVRAPSQIDYKEVLEEVIEDLQCRLDCVNEELDAGEIE